MIIFYTLCCLASSSVSDLVFKFFARKERSRGLFIASVGVCGTILASFLPDKVGDWRMTLLWGVICGIFSAVGNILLLESMGTLSAGICSTIYRLNLALVVPLSVWFFHEKLSLGQYLGVALALAAVVAFLPVGDAGPAGMPRRRVFWAAVMVVSACLFRAGLGISCKYAPMVGASSNGIVVLIDIIWIISGFVYFFVKERRSPEIGRADGKLLAYGTVSGLLITGIIWFMLEALKIKDANASVVLPLTQMSFLFTFMLSVIFLKEKITVRKAVALLCGVGAMLLLSY